MEPFHLIEIILFSLKRVSSGLVLAVAGRCRGWIRLPRPRELQNAMVIAPFDGFLTLFRKVLGVLFEVKFSVGRRNMFSESISTYCYRSPG